jgi:colicin import membrane protein
MALGTTGALIASAAIQAGTSAAGFAQAGKARKEMKKAEAEADKAMAAARKKLEVNYLAGLSIAKEPYELARENLLQRSAALTQAGVEGSTRGAAATAGQVLMAGQAQAAQQRASMSQEMNRLQELAAREESRLQSARVDLDIGEAKGAQQAAADFQAAADAAKAGAIKSAAGALTTGVQIFSENPFDVTKAAGTSGAAPSLGSFSGTDYSTFGQDLINFDPVMPNLTNDPFYQFTQAGVTAPKLP